MQGIIIITILKPTQPNTQYKKLYIVLAFSVLTQIVLHAQDSVQSSVVHQSAEFDLSLAYVHELKEVVVVPILHSLPTITTVIARSIHNAIKTNVESDILTYMVLDKAAPFEDIPLLLYKYLMEYDL